MALRRGPQVCYHNILGAVPPSPAKELFGAYFKQIYVASANDDAIKVAYMRVASMMDGVESLLAPRIVLGVLGSMLRQLAAPLRSGFGKLGQGEAKEMSGEKPVKPRSAAVAAEDG